MPDPRKNTLSIRLYDVAITQPRTPGCPNGSAAGFALTGDYQFEKVFQIPGEDARKSCIIEFEGVYMNAQVYVNGEYAGKTVTATRISIWISPTWSIPMTTSFRSMPWPV